MVSIDEQFFSEFFIIFDKKDVSEILDSRSLSRSISEKCISTFLALNK